MTDKTSKQSVSTETMSDAEALAEIVRAEGYMNYGESHKHRAAVKHIASRFAQQPARGGECPEGFDLNLTVAESALRKLTEIYPITPSEAACIRSVIVGARALAQPRTEQPAAEGRGPDGYAYRYPSMFGDGTVIRHSAGESINGSLPIESIPYYYLTPPRADAEVTGEMVARSANAIVARWARDADTKLSLELAEQLASAALTAALNPENKS